MTSTLTKSPNKKTESKPSKSGKPKAADVKKKAASKKKASSRTTSAKKKPAQGDALFDQVIELTGIPANAIRHELKGILERKNIDVKNLTVEQLRLVAASYVREIMGGILERTAPKKHDPHH